MIFGEIAVLIRKRFTFRQHHSTGFIQRHLDFFHIQFSPSLYCQQIKMLIKNVLNNLGQYIRSRISLGIPKYENKISHSFFQRYCMKYENWKRNMKMYFKNVL